jgi:hypothetical protein
MKQGAKVRDALCALAREYDLVTVYAFGSRAAEIAARVAGERAGLMQALEDLFGAGGPGDLAGG